MNIRNILLASLMLVSDVNCLDPEALHNAITQKQPVHIVTLTRMPADADGSPKADDSEYLPISIAEAATVMELTNVFLGGTPTSTIDKAHGFDESVFSQIQKIYEQLDAELDFVVKTAKEALKTYTILTEDIRDEILRKIQAKQEICITKHVQLKLLGGDMVIELSADKNKRKQYSDISSIKSLMTEENQRKLADKTLKSDEAKPIIFEYKLGDIQLREEDVAKLEDIIRKFSPLALKDTLKAHLYHNHLVLKGYASISQKSIDYYKQLLAKGRSIFEKTIDQATPCLLVVNEQFFGKNFVFPHDFHLQHFVPKFPANVITCVNLLKEEETVLSGLSKIPVQEEPKDSFYSDQLEFTQYNDTLYERTKYFRNVSFYLNDGNIIQKYTKSSYCKEHDSAIKDEKFAYLFGNCLDEGSTWSKLISTQICYDMSSGVRKGQENPSLIHVIQSNRLNIGEYVLHDSQKLEEKNHIPGQPEVIIHSDPSWPEVFTTDHSFTKVFDLSSKDSAVMTKLHYQLLKPKEIFRFFIDNNGYKNAYTITYWVLNNHVHE